MRRFPLAIGALLLLTACSSPPEGAAERRVSLGEFAGPRPVDDDAGTVGRADDDDRDDAAPAIPLAAGPREPAAPAPRRDAESDPAAGNGPTDAPVIVDALVGQVNGRPIYANAFFEPIDDELRAKADELAPRLFMRTASEIISARLQRVVLDELFLAEAESNLTVEQQQGLRAWLRSMEERIVGQKGIGSRTTADQALKEELEGVGVDEYVGDLRDRVVVSQLLQERVFSRVVVSWRDVEREYRRRRDEFNPPPIVHLSRIRVAADDAATIEDVTRRLEAGEPFAAIAEDLDMDDGGAWRSFTLGDDGLAGIDLRADFRDAVAELEPGGTTPPLPAGSSVWWLHLRDLEQPPGTPLHDPELQRQLTASIRGRRENEEQQRFIGSLLEEGIYDEISAMADRLVAIAVLRYAQ